MEVFFSYHPRTEQEFYKRVAAELRNTPFKPLSVNLEERFGNEIHYNVTGLPFSHDAVVVLASPEYARSSWHTKELSAFMAHEAFWERKGRIVPILAEGSELPALLDGKPVVDFSRVDFKDGVAQLIGYLEQVLQPSSVFVIMRLGVKDLDNLYVNGIKPAVERAGLRPYRITDTALSEKQRYIPLEIIRQIGNSSIVIADLTGERPNCYYEAGYAHALKKPVILTAKEGSTVHFDLAGNSILFWKDEADLQKKLTKELKAILKRMRCRNFSVPGPISVGERTAPTGRTRVHHPGQTGASLSSSRTIPDPGRTGTRRHNHNRTDEKHD